MVNTLSGLTVLTTCFTSKCRFHIISDNSSKNLPLTLACRNDDAIIVNVTCVTQLTASKSRS